MGRVFSRFAILVASASCVFGLAATAVPAGGDDVKRDGPLRALLGEPQFDMQTVFGSERFPNIVVALDGTVVATWGNQSVRVCRSDDGGQTWKDWHVVDILPDGHQHRSYGCMGGLVRLPVQGKDILIFSNIDTPKALAASNADWVYFRYLPPKEQMEAVRGAGKRAFIAGATVSGNLPENWRHAAELGIDGILTDYPLEIRTIFRRESNQQTPKP